MSESRAIAPWQQFEAELQSRSDEIAALLPSHVSRERFMRMAVIAVKSNPDILAADRRSVQQAVTRAAEDGLQPDGREGVINVYNEKQKDGSYRKVAAWIPMTHGIRKRALEIAGLIIDAQVVCKADHFVWRQGDQAALEHIPAPLDQEPGPRIGAYAVVKRADGTVLHREVMRKSQLDMVKSTARAQSGLLWTKFEDEAWRKTVVRRATKTVPAVPEALQRILERNDDDYHLTAVPMPSVPALPRASAPALPPPPAIPDAPQKAAAPPPPPIPNVPDVPAVPQRSDADYLAAIEADLAACGSVDDLMEVIEANKAETEARGLQQEIADRVGRHRVRIHDAAKAAAQPKSAATQAAEDAYVRIAQAIRAAGTMDELAAAWKAAQSDLKTLPDEWQAGLTADKDRRKAQLQPQTQGAAA